MSRSIGDAVATSVGCSSEPEFCTHTLTSGDRFLVIASDGIWEYMDSSEVVDILSRYYERGKLQKGVEALMYESRRRFSRAVQMVDDMSIIIITSILVFCQRLYCFKLASVTHLPLRHPTLGTSCLLYRKYNSLHTIRFL